jgi:hypothetical protein
MQKIQCILTIFLLQYVLPTYLFQGSQSTSLSQPQGPLPDSSFICSSHPVARPVPLTTCTKAGKTAADRKRNAAGTSSKDGNQAPAKNSKPRKGAAANKS